jgi:hypothetical protein
MAKRKAKIMARYRPNRKKALAALKAMYEPLRAIKVLVPPSHAAIIKRYQQSEEVSHHADCRFYGVSVCTCGLLHDLAQSLAPQEAFPAYLAETSRHDEALDALAGLADT